MFAPKPSEGSASSLMEEEREYGPIPEFKQQSNADQLVSGAEAEGEAHSVQSIAKEVPKAGFAPEPEAADYEAVSRNLEHIEATDSGLADDIISASLSEVDLRERIGSVRFELFKQVQNESLNRTGEEFRYKYRALLEPKNETAAERYDRLRTGVARITRELYAKLLREIAADKRTWQAGAGDVMLIEEALGTVEGRLMPMLSRVAEAELDAYYANSQS